MTRHTLVHLRPVRLHSTRQRGGSMRHLQACRVLQRPHGNLHMHMPAPVHHKAATLPCTPNAQCIRQQCKHRRLRALHRYHSHGSHGGGHHTSSKS
jgi:hypothetical protein